MYSVSIISVFFVYHYKNSQITAFHPKKGQFGLTRIMRLCYSITTLSPLIVIYRQVMPNHRKIGAFGGRKVKNRAITGNRKNRKSEDFW